MWYSESSKNVQGQLPDVEYPSPPKYSEITGDKTNGNDSTWKLPKDKTENKLTPAKKPATPPAEPAEDLRWAKLIYIYTQTTTFHGVRYIAESSVFVARRVLWFLMVSAAFGFFVFYSYNRLNFFFQYKKNINVEVEYKRKVQFPVVTFCNQNPFRITAVANRNWYPTVKELYNTSSTRAKRSCGSNEFECTSDKSCIASSRRCDMFPDCLDNSDENNCDNPNSLPSKLSAAVGKKFEYQYSTFNGTHHVYITREQEYVFMYKMDGFWKISERHNKDKAWAQIKHSAHLPQNIANKSQTTAPGTWSYWQVYKNGVWEEDKTFTVYCGHAFLDLLKEENVTLENDLTLDQLYNVSSHQEQDFIQSCKWKGVSCMPSSIIKKNTDMGVCFTFQSKDMAIEQSGPGNGLTLTINIEQYEYTKSTEDGIGIKLLLHDKNDVPMMAERGQAISPGLFSYISVETTMVEDLGSPYGNCKSLELDYYNNYTLTRCKTECELKRVMDTCSCRDLHMPEKNGKPDVCTIRQYIDCGKRMLDEMRAAGNYCTCPSPCRKEEYVPTTSFSVILGGEGNFQDEKTMALQTKLSTAREVTYRVVKERYMGTMRIFHIMNQQMLWMKKFTKYVNDTMLEEYDKATTRALMVKADCVWMRTISYDVRSSVDKDILLPIEDFKSILLTRTKDGFTELESVINGTMNVIQMALDAYGVTWPLYMQNDPIHVDYMRQYDDFVNKTIQRNNLTLWQTATRLVSSLTEIKDQIHVDLLSTLNKLNTTPYEHFTLNETLFNPVRPDIGSHCTWCVTTPPEPVFDILKKRVLAKVGADITTALSAVITDTQSAFDSYLSYDWVKLFWRWNRYPVEQITFTSFRDIVKLSYAKIITVTENIQKAIDDTEEVLMLVDDLVAYAWGLQCQTKLPKLLNEYNGNQVVMSEMLIKMYKYLENKNNEIYNHQNKYSNNGITLEGVANNIKFDEISSNIHGLKLRLDSSLNDRGLLLADIEKQINQIYYVIMSQVGGTSSLHSVSQYWQMFSISKPDAHPPTLKTIGGKDLPLLDYTMITDGTDSQYWSSLIDDLKSHETFLQQQLDAIDNMLATAKQFFQDYVAANQINTDFYSKNFLNVELFYKELTENKVSQLAAYEYQNLLSELGGLMGLLLGASVLTLGEIADLFIYNAFRKCLRSKVQPSPSPTPQPTT